MLKILRVLVFLSLTASASAAPRCGDLDRAAAGLASRVAERPAALPDLFDRSLFSRVSEEELAAVLAGLWRGNGPVASRVLVSSDAACSAHYLLETSRGYAIPAAFSLNAVTGKVDNVFFGAPYRKDATLASVRAELAALPGKAGLAAVRFGTNPETLESLSAGEPFSVGPAFKLYILGAMLERKVPWTRVVRLREEDKSPLSGRLRDWPDGSPLTAHTLAALMLSENDDSAADALIAAVGRRRIEAALPALGNSAPGLLTPFLSTGESFRLKTDSAAALEYRNLPLEEKYGRLARLGPPPPAPAASAFGPLDFDWPVSPADLCRLMKYFLDKDDRTALELLALGPAQQLPPGAFLYAGSMGGSGPGTLSAAWLLKDTRSDWYCVSAAWNSGAEPLEEKKFYGIMGSALEALAAPRP